MSKTYCVVLPCDPDSGEDTAFVAEFENRDDAIEYCMATFGTDNQGRINLIVESDDEESDDEGGGGGLTRNDPSRDGPVGQNAYVPLDEGVTHIYSVADLDDFASEVPTVNLGRPDHQEMAIEAHIRTYRDLQLEDH
jgi:hypothetical protein